MQRDLDLKLDKGGISRKGCQPEIVYSRCTIVAETCFETMLRVFRLRGLGVKVKMLSYTLRGLTVTKVRAVECYD